MMSIVSFAKETITVLRAPLVKDHGSMIRDWDNAAQIPSPGWSVQPGGPVEDENHREATRADWTAYGPYGADVLATDKIRLPSGDYKIIGEPARFKSPTGRLSNTVLSLQRWADH